MANDNLKNAVNAAGLTAEALAEIVQVDPKTVQRWVAGKATPYPRHRSKIARALDLTEHQLWPEDTPAPPAEPSDSESEESATGDVIASWAHVTDPGVPGYLTFLAQAQQRADVRDTGGYLPEDLIEVLRARAFDGCDVRVLTRPSIKLEDPDSLGGIALRTTDTGTLPAGFRADDEILLVIHLSSSPPPPALLHLRHRTADGMFSRVETEFQKLWDAAEILHEPPPTSRRNPKASRDLNPPTAPPAHHQQHTSGTAAETETRRWPRQPN